MPDALALLHTSQPADSPKDSSHPPNLFLSSIKLRPFPPQPLSETETSSYTKDGTGQEPTF